MEVVSQKETGECEDACSTKFPQRPVTPKPAEYPRRRVPLAKSQRGQEKQDDKEMQGTLSVPQAAACKHADTHNQKSNDFKVGCDTVVLGRCQVLQRIGHGSYGQVWEAIHLKTAAKQVIKVVDVVHEESADREVKTLNALPKHPHVIQLSDWVASRHNVYIFLQYGGSDNLSQLIQRQVGQRLEIDYAMDLFHDVTAAVAHLHKYDMCHLDIKPENVMVGDDDVIRLCDFGAAQSSKNPLMQPFGTWPFMAPEVLDTLNWKVNFFGDLADCFSMGVLLFELCFGYNSMSYQLGLKVQSMPKDRRSRVVLPARMRNVLSERRIFCKEALESIHGKLEHEQALLNALDDLLSPAPFQRSSLEDLFKLEC